MISAVFYDLEGTLISTNLVHSLFFVSKNQTTLWQKMFKTTITALSIPIFIASDLYSRNVFNALLFKHYKGQSEDHLSYLSKKLFEDVFKPNIFPGVFELISQSRSLGMRQVVVTGALDMMVKPLMEHFGIDDYVANRLEFINGIATGYLLPPVLAGNGKASWIRSYAKRESISLRNSFAYSDSISDLPMLSTVGHPVVVNPDRHLRLTALRYSWPILDLK